MVKNQPPRPPTIFDIFPLVLHPPSQPPQSQSATTTTGVPKPPPPPHDGVVVPTATSATSTAANAIGGIIPQPGPNDILCGKDKTYSLHIGNRNYKKLIDSQGSRYATSKSKQEKMDLTKYIVDVLKQSGSRFLEPVTNGNGNDPNGNGTTGWKELSDSKARDKISHALRFYAKHNNSGGPPTPPALHQSSSSSSNHQQPPPVPPPRGAMVEETKSSSSPTAVDANKRITPLASLRPIPPPQLSPDFLQQQQQQRYNAAASVSTNGGNTQFYVPSVGSNSNATNNSAWFHPLGLLGVAAEFIQSTNSINNGNSMSLGTNATTATSLGAAAAAIAAAAQQQQQRSSLSSLGGGLGGTYGSSASLQYSATGTSSETTSSDTVRSTSMLSQLLPSSYNYNNSDTVRSMDSYMSYSNSYNPNHNYNYDQTMNTLKSHEMRELLAQVQWQQQHHASPPHHGDDDNDDQPDDTTDHDDDTDNEDDDQDDDGKDLDDRDRATHDHSDEQGVAMAED
jgi:hypothetical protein